MSNLDKGAGKAWKITICVIVGLFLAATVASLVIAGRKVSRVVDTEYYSHGLHYAESHGKGENTGEGWTMTTSVVKNQSQVIVLDKGGSPVNGGIVLFEPDRTTGNPASGALFLRESSPGMYRILKPENAGGDLRGTIRFTKGGATITGKVVVIH